ncbi:hypothetical protein J7E70_30220 [Variovorax paradoxus]|nr:hypothetical protein [Variovorax paradoxus]MBT2304698.1 hypothetical protein [Variovorax paradoxus]
MLEERLDEQMIRVLDGRMDRLIAQLRDLGLPPDALALAESQIRAAALTTARTLRRDLNGGHEH